MATKSPEEMAKSMLANVPEKTGRALEEWFGVLEKAGLEKHGEMVKLLKTEHSVTHGFANLIVHEYRGRGNTAAASADPVAAQYAGAKAALRPIYDAIVEAVQDLGGDVEIAPKKTYVSLRRSKQFALVQPSTRTRVDLGLNLKGVEPGERLEASGSFSAMVSHRVRLTAPDDVDKEVIAWLRQAHAAA
jgi:hypothetical protein